jgi:hypothetical protein
MSSKASPHKRARKTEGGGRKKKAKTDDPTASIVEDNTVSIVFFILFCFWLFVSLNLIVSPKPSLVSEWHLVSLSFLLLSVSCSFVCFVVCRD